MIRVCVCVHVSVHYMEFYKGRKRKHTCILRYKGMYVLPRIGKCYLRSPPIHSINVRLSEWKSLEQFVYL